MSAPAPPPYEERLVEALLFASAAPLTRAQLAQRLPEGVDVAAVVARIAARHAGGGIELAAVAGGWAFRTAPDLASVLRPTAEQPRRLTRAALEALAIIAYHQPVTRAEIEEIRGVALSKGSLDQLLEAQWIRPRGRKRVPGRPMTWGTTDAFLDHFGLSGLDDLPGVEELRAAGLLDRRPNVTTIAMRGEEAADDEGDRPADDEAPDELETAAGALDDDASGAADDDEVKA